MSRFMWIPNLNKTKVNNLKKSITSIAIDTAIQIPTKLQQKQQKLTRPGLTHCGQNAPDLKSPVQSIS